MAVKTKAPAVAKLQIEVHRIHRITGDGKSKTKAYVDVKIQNAYVVKGFRVVEGERGLWVSDPQMKSQKDGKFYDTSYAIDRGVREQITETILEAYKASE